MMYRNILTAMAILLTALSLLAQDSVNDLTASKCLSEAPTVVFSLIDNPTRLDMLDYYQAGLDRPSSNAMDQDCRVTALSPYSVDLIGGTDIKYQLFVLNPSDTEPIIGIIETLGTPYPDSKVDFYNSRWHKLSYPLLPEPKLADWLKDKKHRADVEEALPFIMASYAYDPDSKQLTITNNMTQYYLSADTPKALAYVKDKLVYDWTGRNFKLQK